MEMNELKFLGLPLKQIGELLRKGWTIVDALQRQQRVLAEKRRQLDQAILAIGAAERSLQSAREPDWKLFKHIIQEIEMQNDTQWSKKYYSDDAQAKVEERRALWSPELQERVTKDWSELFADIESSLGADPASPTAQALADRWKELLAGFTGGDPEIQKGLNAMYADQNNWPTEQKQKWQIRPEIMTFIQNAFAAGTGR